MSVPDDSVSNQTATLNAQPAFTNHGHRPGPRCPGGALPTAEDRKGCYVFPRQIVKATPWLGQLWSNISVLKSKPTLIVWGMKDIAFREKELKRWEGAFPEARTVRLSLVGHFVQEEAPDELAAAVVPFLFALSQPRRATG